MVGHYMTLKQECRGKSWKGEIVNKDNSTTRGPTKEENDAFFKGVDAAMRRAAVEARRRAIETTGSVGTWRDGKLVRDTEV